MVTQSVNGFEKKLLMDEWGSLQNIWFEIANRKKNVNRSDSVKTQFCVVCMMYTKDQFCVVHTHTHTLTHARTHTDTSDSDTLRTVTMKLKR